MIPNAGHLPHVNARPRSSRRCRLFCATDGCCHDGHELFMSYADVDLSDIEILTIETIAASNGRGLRLTELRWRERPVAPNHKTARAVDIGRTLGLPPLGAALVVGGGRERGRRICRGRKSALIEAAKKEARWSGTRPRSSASSCVPLDRLREEIRHQVRSTRANSTELSVKIINESRAGKRNRM